MDTRDALEQVHTDMENNAALPLYGSAHLVFGEGDPHARVMFIGEAPGRKEDELSRPFVGQSGKLVDKMLAQIGWPRESVYITNIVKRRPPENRDPNPEEIAAYRPYLQKQIDIIQPALIVTLGRFSMNYFLSDAKIATAHGREFHITDADHCVVPLYHPAAALRSGKMMQAFVDDFKKLPTMVDRDSTRELTI